MESTVPTNNRVKRWERKAFHEYIRDGRFASYMGSDEFSMIQLKDLKKLGEELSITLVNRLQGDGRVEREVLEGFEEEMVQRTCVFKPKVVRHAVLHLGQDEDFSAIDLVEEKNALIKDWFMEKMRDQIISALGSISVSGSTTPVAYASASEAEKDAYLVDNSDRVLFGNATANNSANDHSASLANIDNTADKFIGTSAKLMKRLAKNANPKVRPIKVEGDEEWYVVLCGSNTFRDFGADSDVKEAHKLAWERGQDNPLFTGGDLIYDGMIVREIPEIPNYAGVGAGGIQVAPVYLCGAQNLGIGWKQKLRMIQQVRDYGERKGAGGREFREIKKLFFGKGASDRDDLVQHGLVTGYFASVDD